MQFQRTPASPSKLEIGQIRSIIILSPGVLVRSCQDVLKGRLKGEAFSVKVTLLGPML